MIKKCEICGKEFEPISNNQKYCGEGCRRKATYRNGGYEHLKPRLKRANKMKKYKDDCLNLFGYKCAICGWNELDQARKLLSEDDLFKYSNDLAHNITCGNNVGTMSIEVHHIIPVSNGGGDEINNLIALCPNCHRLAHKKILNVDMLNGITTKKISEATNGKN